MAGDDPYDSTCRKEPVPDYTAKLNRDLGGVRLGLPKEYFGAGIDPQITNAVKAAITQLESLGADILEVSLPHTEYAVAAYYMIASAEASANLARFDGVRYGYRAENPANLLDLYSRTRAEGALSANAGWRSSPLRPLAPKIYHGSTTRPDLRGHL